MEDIQAFKVTNKGSVNPSALAGGVFISIIRAWKWRRTLRISSLRSSERQIKSNLLVRCVNQDKVAIESDSG